MIGVNNMMLFMLIREYRLGITMTKEISTRDCVEEQ